MKNSDLADGLSSKGSSMLKALLVYGLCSCGLMGFQTLHSNELYIEKLGLFYRLFNLFFFPKLSLPHGFSIRGKVERLSATINER